MPSRPARIAACCGRKVNFPNLCPCQVARQKARKNAFDRKRPSARARGYGVRWDAERRAFLALNPRCARCRAPATVLDHIRPHRGDETLFWDRNNWQPLCQHCHNSSKQAEEKRGCEAV